MKEFLTGVLWAVATVAATGLGFLIWLIWACSTSYCGGPL